MFCRIVLGIIMGSKIGLKLIPLWIFLTLLLVAVAAPVVLVGIIWDGHVNTTEYPQSTMEEMGSRAFLKGLNSISDDGKLTVGINRGEINGIITSVAKEKTNIKGVENIYILSEDDKLNVYLEVKMSSFQTRISMSTTLVADEDAFRLSIESFKVGGITLQKDLAQQVLDKLGVDVGAPQNFEGFVLDLKNWELRMPKDILYNALESGSGQNDFITNLFKIIKDNDLVLFQSGTENLVQIQIDLSKLSRNAEYLTSDDDHLIVNKPSSPYALLGVDEINAEVNGKLGKLVPFLTKDKLGDVFNYLFYGYESSSDSVKTFMQNFGNDHHDELVRIGIPDVTKYVSYGDMLKSNSGSLLGNANAQISYAAIGSNSVCRIDETFINKYIQSLGFIGYSNVVTHESQDGSFDYAYFIIDNFYCNIIDNKFYFVVGLNINGYETNIILEMNQMPKQAGSTKTCFQFSNVYLGEVNAQSLLDTVMGLLKDNVAGDEAVGFTSIDGQPCFYFDVAPIMDKVHEFDPTITADQLVLSAKGSSINDEGYIGVEIIR